MAKHLVKARLEVEEFRRTVEALHHRLERILRLEEAILVGANDLVGGKAKVSAHVASLAAGRSRRSKRVGRSAQRARRRASARPPTPRAPRRRAGKHTTTSTG